jgi:hypothetical protein
MAAEKLALVKGFSRAVSGTKSKGPLERNQSKRVIVVGDECGFYFHPSDEDLSLGTPGTEKAARLTCLRDTSTLVPL